MNKNIFYALITKLAFLIRQKSSQSFIDNFITVMQPNKYTSIIDIGGATGELMVKIRDRLNSNNRIVIADIDKNHLLIASKKYGFDTLLLNDNNLFDINDNYFDIVFCNAVIEHATSNKSILLNNEISPKIWNSSSLRAQQLFAGEI